MRFLPLALAGAGLAVVAAACSGGNGAGATNPAPAVVTAPPTFAPTAAPASSITTMNTLTSYTVYVGSTDGTEVVTELSPLSSGTAGPNGYFGAPPVDLLTSGTPQAPTRAAGALITFPDNSTVVTDALGNFDASQSPWAAANAANISAGLQVEVLADTSDQFPSAQPASAFVDVDEPNGTTVPAGAYRYAQASASPAPSPTPAVIAKLTVTPSSEGMFDGEQRVYHAVGFDKTGKKVQLGKQPVKWTVANCSGAKAAGSLLTTSESSNIVYRAPKTGTAGTCPDVLTASYQAPGSTTAITGTGKAFYHSKDVLYSGTVVDAKGRPVAKAIVDFFATAASNANGRILTTTGAKGNFSRKLPSGRTPSFLVANRTQSGSSVTYTWYNVTVKGASATATTGLTLTETTVAAHPPHG